MSGFNVAAAHVKPGEGEEEGGSSEESTAEKAVGGLRGVFLVAGYQQNSAYAAAPKRKVFVINSNPLSFQRVQGGPLHSYKWSYKP